MTRPDQSEAAHPPRTTTTYGIPVDRDPEGFPLCRQCKTSIRTGKRPKQRTFCDNQNCLHEWKLKSDTGYQVQHVLERDKGVCVLCGLDCIALLKSLETSATDEGRTIFGADKVIPVWAWGSGRQLPGYAARCDELGLPRHLRGLTRRLWEMDHELPVVEGGGSCGLENLRTLCWRCHRDATTALAKRRAEARKKQARLPGVGQ